jgi:hypothetical protein
MSINHIDTQGNNFAHHQMKSGNTAFLEWFANNNGDLDQLNRKGYKPAHEYFVTAFMNDPRQVKEDVIKLFEFNYLNEKDLSPSSELSGITDRFLDKNTKKSLFNSIKGKTQKNSYIADDIIRLN